MATLTLTSEQLQLLINVLQHYLSELQTEIAHTDKREFRDELKEQKQSLLRIMALINGKTE